MKRISRTVLPAAGLSLLALGPVQGQEWNAPRTLDLVDEARMVRQSMTRDPGLRSYSAQARGYVYFFFDREDTGERILVKTDQIALEVFWRTPNLTMQRIVGLRDEKSLPTNIRYHLDHLVVVQDEFGDRIRIGDGDEVEAVVHPVAPGSDRFYDYLLADSVTVILPGAGEPVRVYEIQVRPRNFDLPGFVGSVFIDRASKAIVRMSFTFTPASYVDSYLDYIQISLENGLWLGNHWLPYRQQLEIRREVPYLDIPAGSVIRGWFDIRDYEINPPLPLSLFQGRTITALPESTRREFPFEDSLHAHLDLEGLSPPPEMREIRSLALAIAKERYLSGLGKLRLFLPESTASSIARFNRSEGIFLGAGASYALRPWAGIATHGGFSFGRERPSLAVTLHGGERLPRSGFAAHWNLPRKLGPVPAISGVMNSLAALTLDRDYQDIFFATGVSGFHAWTPWSGAEARLEGRWEEHRSGRDVVSSDPSRPRFRPVFPVPGGPWASLSLGLTSRLGEGPWTGRVQTQAGHFDDHAFGRVSAALLWHRRNRTRGFEGRVKLEGGRLLGEPPPQALFLLGGRGTLPGYGFRSFVGDRFWLLRTEVSQAVLEPWLRLRVFAASGGTGMQSGALPSSWPQRTTPTTRFSAGAGLGLGWDVIRLDAARGLNKGGRWEIILAINPDFWSWL
jgi:hypothetical protein